MKKYFVFAIMMMAMCVGFTACGGDDSNGVVNLPEEKVEEVSGAQAVLENTVLQYGVYFKKFKAYEFVYEGEDKFKDYVSITMEEHVVGAGYKVGGYIYQNGKKTFTFPGTTCENARISTVNTGDKDHNGLAILNVELYIPKMYDAEGKVVKDLRMKFTGTINTSDMLEY